MRWQGKVVGRVAAVTSLRAREQPPVTGNKGNRAEVVVNNTTLGARCILGVFCAFFSFSECVCVFSTGIFLYISFIRLSCGDTGFSVCFLWLIARFLGIRMFFCSGGVFLYYISFVRLMLW